MDEVSHFSEVKNEKYNNSVENTTGFLIWQRHSTKVYSFGNEILDAFVS